jgi:hypothetical protein
MGLLLLYMHTSQSAKAVGWKDSGRPRTLVWLSLKNQTGPSLETEQGSPVLPRQGRGVRKAGGRELVLRWRHGL